MTDSLSQQGRIGTLTTSAGDTALVLNRFEGSEGLGELFEYRIGAISEQENFDFSSLLGKNACVKILCVDGQERDFNGVMVEGRWNGVRNNLYHYQMVLRPWLSLLSRTSDCRIFPKMKAPDIIKQVFTDRGFSDFRDALTGSYPTLEYTVQYRETDLNFVCRMMEKFGIYYYFEHSKDKHELVLADSPTCHQTALASVPYLPMTGEVRRDQQQFDSWATYRGFQTGVYTLEDYNYETPSADMEGTDNKAGSYEHGSMELYDYAIGYPDKGAGTTLAKVREEAEQAKDDHRTAIGSAPSLYPGGKTTLEGHPTGSENKEYLILRCTHSYIDQTYISGGGSQTAYSGSYEMMDASRQFRSPLVTRKAVVQGPQSALVVGQQGEEIDVDVEGRITVQFYWDRKKKPSRRVRVAQFWAGSHRGALFIPRIGDEVMIHYEDGDPDRPIVVGSVYNGTNTVPTDLPSKKTRSGILTKSSKNSSGYNMLLFDDTAGDEHIKLRAQKDLMFKALNNQEIDILGDITENVGTMTSGGNFTMNAVQTMTINVGPPGEPLTQIIMTNEDITLNVGPEGLLSQIVMNATGITLSATPASQLMIQPEGITTMTPTITFMAEGPITFVSPMVTIPVVTIGAGTSSGMPII